MKGCNEPLGLDHENAFGKLAFIRKRETAHPTFLELLMASVFLIDTMVSAKNSLLQKYDIRSLVETIDHRAEHKSCARLCPETAIFSKARAR